MDKANQMEFLFEEGGMADDGLDRDPVSGNEVPSGSMSEEVRDDIPAQLSEGEYVVPADVVRFFGVKYFEDLRKDAKMGLTQMEQEGRIGGEPVDVEGDDTELTSEEMAELNAIMGMAEGGAVTTTYDRLPPLAVGNTGQEQQLANVEQQMTRAFQEGGDVLPIGTQLSPDYSGFGAGYTFGTTPVGSLYPTPPVGPITTVTLYSPEGASLPFNLPTQQADYDSYIAQGWTTQPPAAPVAEAPVQQPTGSDNDDATPMDYSRSVSQGATGSRQFSLGDIETIRTDPIGYATGQLQRDTTTSRVAGGIVSLIGGPLGAIGGGALAVAGDIGPIANARAALLEAQRQNELNPGRYTAEQIETLQNGINARISELPFASRSVLGLGSVGTGKQYAGQIERAVKRLDNIYSFDATRPSYLGGARGIDVLENVSKAAASLQGRAAQDYAETVERNSRVDEDKVRTGSAAGDVAVGNISGVDGIAGVVVNPDTGKVIRDDDGKTVFRDNEGRTYVRTGLLGNGIEYRDVQGVPASGTPPPQSTQGVDTGNNDNSKGEGSVICTALFNKGLLSKEIFMLDTQYGLMLESSQPEVTYGYRKMATPLATYIQKDTLGATIARTLVAPVAKAWANEMAHQMQPENYKGNLLGKAIIKLGYPVCAFVGKRSKEIVYGT